MNLCLRLAMSWAGRRVFTPPDPPAAVAWQSVTANGSDGTTTTTQLTFTFDVDPGELSAANFTIDWATKGTMTGTGTTRVLPISDITADNNTSQSVTLASNSSGYTITPTSRSVTVYVEFVANEITFISGAANGESDVTTSNSITLTFSEDPTGLAASDITVTGATKGALSGSGTTRALAISSLSVDDSQTLNVAIADNNDNTFSPNNRDVTVYVEAAATQVAWETLTANGSPAPAAVAWESLTANGDSETETTALTFTFDVDPTTLTASDIALTNCTKGALSGTGLTRTLAVSEITDTSVQATITNPDGFDIDPLVRTVSVFEAPAATANKLLSTDNLPSGDDWGYNLITDNGLDAFGARILEAQAGGTGERRVSQADVPLPPDTYEMFSFYAKYDDHKYLGWRVSVADGSFRNIIFDVELGTVITGSNSSRHDTYLVSAADGDGFKRYSFRLVERNNAFVSLVMFNAAQEYDGTVASPTSVSVKNVQIENGSTLTDYSAGA